MSDPIDRWGELPDATRAHVLGLLASLIARGVLIDGPEARAEVDGDA